MEPKDLDKLISKYLEGKCQPEEVDFIESWYSSLGSRNSVVSEDKDVDSKISSAENRILSRLNEHTHTTIRPLQKSRSLSWYYVGIAASLLLCAAVIYANFFLPESTPIAMEQSVSSEFLREQNFTQEPRRVVLPDGSIVVLSAESKIVFSNDIKKTSRELFLEGEAYFDIAHDATRPFYVYAGNVITRVVGTSFVIRNLDNKDVTVSVKTGKVTVYSKKNTHKKTVLTPNNEATYSHSTDLVATQRSTVRKDAWEDNYVTEMHFEETPVSEVLETLIKTYRINIQFDKETLAGCVLTSSFFEEGLYDRIDVICTAIGATYKIVDTQILVESNGCNLKPNEP